MPSPDGYIDRALPGNLQPKPKAISVARRARTFLASDAHAARALGKLFSVVFLNTTSRAIKTVVGYFHLHFENRFTVSCKVIRMGSA